MSRRLQIYKVTRKKNHPMIAIELSPSRAILVLTHKTNEFGPNCLLVQIFMVWFGFMAYQPL